MSKSNSSFLTTVAAICAALLMGLAAGVALAFMELTMSSPKETNMRPYVAPCSFSIKGTDYDGQCFVDKSTYQDTMIIYEDTDGPFYFFYFTPVSHNSAEVDWNGDRAYGHADLPLGVMRRTPRNPNCWVNESKDFLCFKEPE